MAERYSFFNSTPEDVREYQATEFAKYFSRFLSNGIYVKDNLMGLGVSADGFNLTISTGFAYLEGYLYENNANLPITLKTSDNVLDRIDRIVLRLDLINRKMNIKVKEGSLGNNPSIPTLTNNESVKEMPLYTIRVNKNTTAGIIADERLPVHSLIEIPYEDIVREFDEWFEAKQGSVGVEVYSGKVESPLMAAGDIWFRELV